MSDTTLISLDDVLYAEEQEWLGVIVLNNGVQVEWQNQMGGTACGHPTAAGLFIPLPAAWLTRDVNDKDPLDNWYLNTNYEPKLIEKFLAANPDLGKLFEVLEDVVDKAPQSHAWPWGHCWGEAWVPVRIREDQDLLPFPGETAVIVYPNSD